MRKTLSIILFFSVVVMSLYTYFFIWTAEFHITTITPKYTNIQASSLMKLEKQKIADLAAIFSKEQDLLKNEMFRISKKYNVLLIILTIFTFVLSLVLIYLTFKPIKNNKF